MAAAIQAILDGETPTAAPATSEGAAETHLEERPSPPSARRRDRPAAEAVVPEVVESPEPVLAPDALDVAEVAEHVEGDPDRRNAVDASRSGSTSTCWTTSMQLVGELVLTRNQVLQRAERQSEDAELVRASQRLDLVARSCRRAS